MPPGTDDLRLAFRLPRSVRPVSPVTIADHFWVAETAGTYDSVTVFPHRVSRAHPRRALTGAPRTAFPLPPPFQLT
ncbi:hypothetical protein OG292_32455 [Streptomyces sp. NBC_01511]|uniref:hypothetical protein n=1 Tax=unclassified Streptomyces TaxID=2593676 RepID=UPI003867F0D8